MSLKMEIRSINKPTLAFSSNCPSNILNEAPTFILEITHSSMNYIYLNVAYVKLYVTYCRSYIMYSNKKVLEFLIFVCRYSGI